MTIDARLRRVLPAHCYTRVWMRALKSPTPDEMDFMSDVGKIDTKDRAEARSEARPNPRVLVWGRGFQKAHRACEADLRISTSKYGDGHSAQAQAEEMPWMFMFLSRVQDLDHDEKRAITVTDTLSMERNFR
eukprot:11327448-Alexandrium_andersonii.AAC.1